MSRTEELLTILLNEDEEELDEEEIRREAERIYRRKLRGEKIGIWELLLLLLVIGGVAWLLFGFFFELALMHLI